jgi:hypothetical protein
MAADVMNKISPGRLVTVLRNPQDLIGYLAANRLQKRLHLPV